MVPILSRLTQLQTEQGKSQMHQYGISSVPNQTKLDSYKPSQAAHNSWLLMASASEFPLQ